MTRPTADIVADLRDGRGFIKTGPHATFLREAADRLAELDAEIATLKAIVDGCPRCSARASLRAEDL